jgi:hypothetical protein
MPTRFGGAQPMWIDAITRLLTAVSPFMWPLVMLFAVIYFSAAIKERIRSVTELDLKNRVLRWGEAKSDSQSDPKVLEADAIHSSDSSKKMLEGVATLSSGSSNAPKWSNTGNVYWLAYDLTWTAQVTLRAAPKQKILRGLKQAQYHISHLGLADFLAKYNALLKEAEDVPEQTMTAEWRNNFSARISRLSYEIGNLAGDNQPDFEKDVAK